MKQLAPLRLVRAVLVTALVMSLAGAGHLAGGGALPHPAVLIVLAVLVFLPVSWLAGRRLTLFRLLAVMGVAQVGLHEAFAVLWAGMGCSATYGHDGPGGETGFTCLPGLMSVLGSHEVSGAGLVMLAGHLLAGVVTALVLSRAEAAMWSLLEWLRPLLVLPRPRPLPLELPRPCLPPGRRPMLVWRGLRRDRVRGPPAAGASCSARWV